MARAPVRRESGERRYEDIVTIAGELFAEKGFNGTSLTDIATAAGMLKGSLYHYISSKEDLLFDVVKVAHKGLAENIGIADHFAADPLRQMVAFCYGHIVLNAVIERMHQGIVFLQDSKYLPTKRRNVLTKDRDAYGQYLTDILVRGQKAEVFAAELDLRISSFDIFGVITSYLRWFKPGLSITPHMLARDSAAFVQASIQAPNTRLKSVSRYAVVDQVIAEIEQLQAAQVEAA